MEIPLILTIVTLAIQKIIHFYERKDLYNRIMARSLREYKEGSTPSHVLLNGNPIKRTLDKQYEKR
jgi:hypothetical protein